MSGRARLITGVIVAIVLAVTGYGSARLSAGTPSSSSSAKPAAAARTYTFHGLTINLQLSWKPGAVVTETSGTTFNGVVTGGACRTSNFGTDCPGFLMLFQPSYQLGQGFVYQSGAQTGCPQNRGLMQNDFINNAPVMSTVTVGGRSAYLTQYKVLCFSNNPSASSSTLYTQRLWWIPSAQILVVDDGWHVSGLGSVLTSATWVPNTGPTDVMAGYAGTWHRHSDTFVINENQTGSETSSDGGCPNNPSSMCGFTATLSYVLTPTGLKGTYTSVQPTVNGVVNNGYQVPSYEPSQNDSFTLVIDPHDRLRFTHFGHLTVFDGPGRSLLCDDNTPAVYDTCGA